MGSACAGDSRPAHLAEHPEAAAALEDVEFQGGHRAAPGAQALSAAPAQLGERWCYLTLACCDAWVCSVLQCSSKVHSLRLASLQAQAPLCSPVCAQQRVQRLRDRESGSAM